VHYRRHPLQLSCSPWTAGRGPPPAGVGLDLAGRGWNLLSGKAYAAKIDNLKVSFSPQGWISDSSLSFVLPSELLKPAISLQILIGTWGPFRCFPNSLIFCR
jgi:hypothetical protein